MRTVSGSTFAPSVRVLFTFVISFLMIVALQAMVAGDADARKKRKSNPRYAAYVIDAKTGKVLHSRNANAKRYPASLTKMMTLYLVFEDLKSGRIKKTDRLVMTKAGARRQPSKIGLKPGQSISMQQAILTLVTKSANDVSTALGDQLSGSEAKFAKRMTRKARQLGMSRTTFKNANGLTARGQITTAADMAKLGLALREHFPRRFRYFQTRNFKLGRRNYRNHNRLLGKIRGVDGIKTGYTMSSGGNLVSSVSTGNRRRGAWIMGGRSGRSRNAAMARRIKKYLPKASRGGQRRLIARAAPLKSRPVTKKGSLTVASIAKPSIAQKA
ncbi:MAG: D-alanyl-D-alanine carboxypeptidase, partial [Devosiaceae bacterium]|nr:D-alanyl-D-alanine carboxypeptidase [Devosiaceae bacterium]